MRIRSSSDRDSERPRVSAPASACWAGVDVGARRKGFHVAVIRDVERRLELVAPPCQLLRPADVAGWLRSWSPALIGVDAPRCLGDHPSRHDGERLLAREVCRLRYTPTREALERQRTTRAPKYYEWIEHGLELYAALADAGLRAIEAFPTAAWTRWLGPRGREPRSAWSQRALASFKVRGVPMTLNQDCRDAIGAAITAHAHEAGRTETFGDIVVPVAAVTSGNRWTPRVPRGVPSVGGLGGAPRAPHL